MKKIIIFIAVAGLLSIGNTAKAEDMTHFDNSKIFTATIAEREIKREDVRKETATAKMLSRGGSPFQDNVIPVEFIVTGYCPDKACTDLGTGITTSGKKAKYGMVAVPKNIPFGSDIYIEDFTEKGKTIDFHGIAEDRGGAIKQIGNVYKIDVFYPTHAEALAVGKQIRKGYIRIKE